ncbi:MAG: hypothetical protein SAK29_13445 [Scytonema sp. PMC 1069.18]|nr:hypothetical protein [Scytonema sp. PMC 1069.18]MEC4886637.1 hypothetical protein [Scytonema sp. PMC 1070.18]
MNYIGRVLDREKQAPISGAKVSVSLPGEQKITYTDLEGIYKFPVEFGNSNILEGEITIEAKGYKTYNAFLRISPEHQDLGDIRLVYPHVTSSQLVHSPPRESENKTVLPILAAIMVIFALILAALTLPPPQQTQPSEQQDNFSSQ